MRRRWIVIVLAVAVLVAAVTVTTMLWIGRDTASGPECVVPGHSGAADLNLDAVQLQHASTINAVGLARGLPQRARVIALATAWQESSLRNIDHGDRDSLGLFQQRPSQGWGTRAQIIDPVYAAGKFYDALVQVDGWRTEPLTEVAQAVQYSGFPDAYAKWEDEASTLAVALGGTVPPDLTCRAGAQPSTAVVPQRPTVPGTQNMDPGLHALLAAADAELGGLTVRPAGNSGEAVVTVGIDGLTPLQSGRVLAAWVVAHSTGFDVIGVQTVDGDYRDHAWVTADDREPAAGVSAGQVRVGVE